MTPLARRYELPEMYDKVKRQVETMSSGNQDIHLVPPDNPLAVEQDAKFDGAAGDADLLDSGRPLNIRSHWKFKVVGWLGLITSAVLTLVFIRAGLSDSVGIWIVMASMCAFLLIMARSSLKVDTYGIFLTRALGRYCIDWNEVQHIEFSDQMDRVVFYGLDKWLVIPRVVPEVSGQRRDFAKFLAAQARQRRIPISFAAVTPNRQKNTRKGW